MKSLILSYLLLIFGGLLGLHLLYLRRDKQVRLKFYLKNTVYISLKVKSNQMII